MLDEDKALIVASEASKKADALVAESVGEGLKDYLLDVRRTPFASDRRLKDEIDAYFAETDLLGTLRVVVNHAIEARQTHRAASENFMTSVRGGA